jgi:hypothetical protein
MIIVPDTSSSGVDYHLNGLVWKLLLTNYKSAGHALIWPEVVVLELQNRFREKIEKEISNANAAVGEINKLTEFPIPQVVSPKFSEEQLANYSKNLRKTILTSGGTIHKIPNISHRKLLERDLRRLKPFKSSGAGYRDALIWESVLQIFSATKEKIAFITENSTDFTDSKGQLHPHLLQDVVSLNGNKDSISIFLSASDFVKSEIFTNLAKPHGNFLSYLHANYPKFDLGSSIEQILLKHLPGSPINFESRHLSGLYEDPTISMVDSPTDIEIVDDRLEDGQRIIEFTCESECLIDCYIEKFEYFSMDDRIRPSASNWNDTYMIAELYVQLHIRAYAIFDEENGDFTDSEILETEVLSNEYS